MKNMLLTLLAITFLTTACKKEQITHPNNRHTIEIISGTIFSVQTTDTVFLFVRGFNNNKAIVNGYNLTIQNLSTENAIIKINGIEHRILQNKTISYDTKIK